MNRLLKYSVLSLVVAYLPITSVSADINCSIEPPIPSLHVKSHTGSNRHASTQSIKRNAQRSGTRAATRTIQASLYPAQVLKLTGDVRLVMRGGQATNQTLTIGSQLLLGDVVQTGRQSFVTIVLASGVTSVLPANARVALNKTSDTVARYDLLQGSIENYVKKKPNAKRNTFEVTVPNGVLGVRGTHFWVDYDLGNGRSGLSVGEGVVVVRPRQSCSTSLVVTKDHSAIIGETLSDARDTHPILSQPEWSDVRAQRDDNLVFDISSVAGARYYVAQVAKDAGFLDIVAEQQNKSNNPQVKVPANQLDEGFYYVRFAAQDEHGLGNYGRPYLFLLNRKGETR